MKSFLSELFRNCAHFVKKKTDKQFKLLKTKKKRLKQQFKSYAVALPRHSFIVLFI